MSLVSCSDPREFNTKSLEFKKHNFSKDFIEGLECAAGFIGMRLGEEEIEGDYYLNVELYDGVAVVNVKGIIIRGFQRSVISNFFGTVPLGNLIKTLKLLTEKDSVSKIVLRFDSPGGDASGVIDAVNDISILDKVKPIHAYVGDKAASAGYWLASACRTIVSSPVGYTGSIGVLYIDVDDKVFLHNIGYDVNIYVNADAEKKVLEGGMPFVQNEIRRRLDAFAEAMVIDIAERRDVKYEYAKTNWGSGRVFCCKEALTLGLVDKEGFLTNFVDKLKKNNI